jgi:hypothetical protein
VPRESDPHAISPIGLGHGAPHHAPHRHPRCGGQRGRAGREADDGEQPCTWLDAPYQPCVETASAAGLQHGSAFTSLRTRGLAWSALPAPSPPKKKAPADRLRSMEMVHGRLVEGHTGLPQPMFPGKFLNTKGFLPGVIQAGDYALRKLDRQPALFACPTGRARPLPLLSPETTAQPHPR